MKTKVMENYNPRTWGEHTLQIKLQHNELKGCLYPQFRGNIRGLDALRFDFTDLDYAINNIPTSANLHIDYRGETDDFEVEFVKGGTLSEFVFTGEQLNGMIVGIEIIEYNDLPAGE